MADLMEQTKLTGTGQEAAPFAYRLLDKERDLLPLVALANEIDAVDHTDRGSTPEEMRQFLDWPGFDAAHNMFIVDHPTEPGVIIAAGHITREENDPAYYGNVRVQPEWRHRGIASMLLVALIGRARELGAAGLKFGATERVRDGIKLLEAHGFRLSASLLEVRIEAGDAVAAPNWPDGYTVRSYAEAQDFAGLLDGYNRGFLGHHDYHAMAADELRSWLELEQLRPEGIFLAYGPAGDVAGECWAVINERRNARRGEPRGYIDTLAVAPEHRRHGLGRALLLYGVKWLRANGMGPITLHVYGENERALPLYLDAGFKLYRREFEFRLDF